jgi:hypothetical protein
MQREDKTWEKNIKMEHKDAGWGCGLDSSGSEQDPVMRSCEHGNEPSGSIKARESHD